MTRLQFLTCAFGPRAVLCAVAFCACATCPGYAPVPRMPPLLTAEEMRAMTPAQRQAWERGREATFQGGWKVVGAVIARVALLVPLSLFCWWLTDQWVTERCKRCGPLLRHGGDFITGVLLDAGTLGTSLMVASLFPSIRVRSVTVIVVATFGYLAYVLISRRAFDTFQVHSGEAEKKRRERSRTTSVAGQIVAARQEAERYYDAHAEVLTDASPVALFRSCLNAAIPDAIEPQKAWAAAQELIAKIQPVVARERERREEERRAEEERRRREAADAERRRDRDEVGPEHV